MPEDKTSKSPAPSKQADGDDTNTRSGRPNPQATPDHPKEHKSGYGGDGGEPKKGGR